MKYITALSYWAIGMMKRSRGRVAEILVQNLVPVIVWDLLKIQQKASVNQSLLINGKDKRCEEKTQRRGEVIFFLIRKKKQKNVFI